MLDPISVAGCPSITQENFNQLTHDPSDYVLNLSQPITNVTKIKLQSLRLQNDIHNIRRVGVANLTYKVRFAKLK